MATVAIQLLILVVVLYGVFVMSNIKSALADLKAEINANGDAVQAAIVSLKGIADLIAASKDDPDEIEALANELKDQSSALGQAIINNTPAASPNAPATGVTTGSEAAPAASQPATMNAPATPPMAVGDTAAAPASGSSLAGPGA